MCTLPPPPPRLLLPPYIRVSMRLTEGRGAWATVCALEFFFSVSHHIALIDTTSTFGFTSDFDNKEHTLQLGTHISSSTTTATTHLPATQLPSRCQFSPHSRTFARCPQPEMETIDFATIHSFFIIILVDTSTQGFRPYNRHTIHGEIPRYPIHESQDTHAFYMRTGPDVLVKIPPSRLRDLRPFQHSLTVHDEAPRLLILSCLDHDLSVWVSTRARVYVSCVSNAPLSLHQDLLQAA